MGGQRQEIIHAAHAAVGVVQTEPLRRRHHHGNVERQDLFDQGRVAAARVLDLGDPLDGPELIEPVDVKRHLQPGDGIQPGQLRFTARRSLPFNGRGRPFIEEFGGRTAIVAK